METRFNKHVVDVGDTGECQEDVFFFKKNGMLVYGFCGMTEEKFLDVAR